MPWRGLFNQRGTFFQEESSFYEEDVLGLSDFNLFSSIPFWAKIPAIWSILGSIILAAAVAKDEACEDAVIETISFGSIKGVFDTSLATARDPNRLSFVFPFELLDDFDNFCLTVFVFREGIGNGVDILIVGVANEDVSGQLPPPDPTSEPEADGVDVGITIGVDIGIVGVVNEDVSGQPPLMDSAKKPEVNGADEGITIGVDIVIVAVVNEDVSGQPPLLGPAPEPEVNGVDEGITIGVDIVMVGVVNEDVSWQPPLLDSAPEPEAKDADEGINNVVDIGIVGVKVDISAAVIVFRRVISEYNSSLSLS